MPSYGCDDSGRQRRRADRIKAKLRKLGIDPRSNKWNTLFFRWMRQR